MPLLDHFHPPLSIQRPWEGFYSTWATMIAQELNRLLPSDYVAIPQTSHGPAVEVDVATFQMALASATVGNTWTPEAPAWVGPVEWPERDLFEVGVFDQREGPRLVGAVELVSPANKDRPTSRHAFAGKCAGYLRQGIGLIVADVVTIRRQDLHRQLLDFLELDAEATPVDGLCTPVRLATDRFGAPATLFPGTL